MEKHGEAWRGHGKGIERDWDRTWRVVRGRALGKLGQGMRKAYIPSRASRQRVQHLAFAPRSRCLRAWVGVRFGVRVRVRVRFSVGAPTGDLVVNRCRGGMQSLGLRGNSHSLIWISQRISQRISYQFEPRRHTYRPVGLEQTAQSSGIRPASLQVWQVCKYVSM